MNTNRKRRRRGKQWTLLQVKAECRSALIVWCALLEMAGERGSRMIFPTHKRLEELTGIKRPGTLSKSITTLDAAGWIQRTNSLHNEPGKGFVTFSRVIIRRGQYSTISKTHKKNMIVKKRHRSNGRKTSIDSSKEERVRLTPPPLPCGEGSSTPPSPAIKQLSEEEYQAVAKRVFGSASHSVKLNCQSAN